MAWYQPVASSTLVCFMHDIGCQTHPCKSYQVFTISCRMKVKVKFPILLPVTRGLYSTAAAYRKFTCHMSHACFDTGAATARTALALDHSSKLV